MIARSSRSEPSLSLEVPDRLYRTPGMYELDNEFLGKMNCCSLSDTTEAQPYFHFYR